MIRFWVLSPNRDLREMLKYQKSGTRLTAEIDGHEYILTWKEIKFEEVD